MITLPTRLFAISVLSLLLSTSLFTGEKRADDMDSNWDISIPFDISFDIGSIRMECPDGLLRISSHGYGAPQEEGAPFVPERYVRVLIPAATDSLELSIASLDRCAFSSGPISSIPVQSPIGLPGPESPSRPYSLEIGSHLSIASEGSQRGFRVLELRFDPVLPKDGGFEVCTSIRGSIMVRIDPYAKVVGGEAPPSIEDSVINPQDIATFGCFAYTPTGTLPNGTFDYVIITDTSKVKDAFDDLVGWKVKKGLPSTVYTIPQIYSNYTGKNNAEKVRNFIRDAVATWGAKYVLLGGDTGIIPYRGLYCSAGGYTETDIASDLYYSALDGDFDADGDGTYGETSDQVDLYYDVIVGRAPVQTNAEAVNFVDRVLHYERYPLAGYLDRVLFAGEYLDSTTNSSLGLDMIKATLPQNSAPTSLYDRSYGAPGTLSKNSFIGNINTGVNYAFHSGHSNENTMSMGSPGGGTYDLYTSDMGKYNGSYRLGIVNSLGCIANRFNVDDCIAEEHVKRSNGGSVAFIGNSRYGWYAGGAPGWGTSEVFQAAMANNLYTDSISSIGGHFAEGKNDYAGYATSGTARWVMYALNLIGDPEPYVWTADPSPLNVTCPDWIGMNCAEYTVLVCNSTGSPIKDARVCIVQNGYYEVGITNASGYALFHPNITSSAQAMVTITAWNHLPFERNISVDLIAPSIQTNITDLPTTGDPYILKLQVWDDYGVRSVRLSYRQGSDPNDTVTELLFGNGTAYGGTIQIEPDSLDDLCFAVSVEDESGNSNSTTWKNVSVLDNDKPSVRIGLPRSRPTTGGTCRVQAFVEDNIEVARVNLYTMLNGNIYDQAIMERNGTDTWMADVFVQGSSRGNLSFRIDAYDGSDNLESGSDGDMEIVDDDPIAFLGDMSDTEGTTGETVRFKAMASDNWDIDLVFAEWRPTSSSALTTIPLLLNGSMYEGSLDIPDSFRDSISYILSGGDGSGNWNETIERTIQIFDNDVPNIVEDRTPSITYTGDIIPVSIIASDNVGLADAFLIARQGPRILANVTVDPDTDGLCSYLLTVPDDTTTTICYEVIVRDESGNPISTGPKNITVIDDDPPRIVKDLSDRKVKVGSMVNYTIMVSDNVGIGSVSIEWWIAGSSEKTCIDLMASGDKWVGSTFVPENATGMLSYMVQVVDPSGNKVESGRQTISLIIPPPPDEPDDPLPSPGEDSDNDGMEDLWELRHNLTIGINDSAMDMDNDTWSNIEEYRAGTDPEDPADHPIALKDNDGTGSDYLAFLLTIIVLGAIIIIMVIFLIARRMRSEDFSVEME